MTMYYKNSMAGGTEGDRNSFYNLLNDVKEKSIGSSSEWSGDYLVTKYELNDGTIAIYMENVELGIPHSIEII